MSNSIHKLLLDKLSSYRHQLKKCLQKINIIETRNDISINEKMGEIKIIREELNKVGTEIDNVKREIMLLDRHNIN